MPDYVAMEIPLDKEQYSLNLNTGVETSQDEDKGAKVEQFDKEQYSSNLNISVDTSQDGSEKVEQFDKEQYSSNLNTSVDISQDEDEDAKVEQSIMSRGLD